MRTSRGASADEAQQEQWNLNYKEAAVFLEEGRNGENFRFHPQNQKVLRYYLIIHHTAFQVVYLISSIILMALAIFEWPTEPAFILLSINITCPIELVCLGICLFEQSMTVKWIGVRKLYKDLKVTIKLLVTFILIVDAVWVLAAQENHPRFTRCFRPIFLIDSGYLRGTRFFLIHVLKSVAPAVDVLILICFTILTYSVVAFNIFGGGVNGDIWFTSFNQSFVSMFILLTTANFPDVMMAVYNYNRWNAALFISYLSITLYFLMNLVYAVVYDKFSTLEKKLTKRLFLQRRYACRMAFKLLVTKSSPRLMSVRHFAGMMHYYMYRRPRSEVYLIFKLLNKRNTGQLTLNEFYGLYDACLLNWSAQSTKKRDFWFEDMRCLPDCLHILLRTLHSFVRSWTFRGFIYIMIIANFIQVLIQTVSISNQLVASRNASVTYISWYTIMFTAIFILEIFLKLLALGPKYFFNAWNVFELTLTVLSVIGICIPQLQQGGVAFVLIMRPIKFVQLMRYRRRYRYIFSTMFLIMRRCIQLAIAIMCIYYFFAIIGMELFGGYDLTNCCKNTMVQANFQGPEFGASRGYYMLDTFQSLLISGVTLFHLTVVNNWFIPMEGHAFGITPWARLFFMFYFFVTVILFSTVFAYIVEAFVFHMNVAMTTNHLPEDHTRIRETVYLNEEEINMLHSTDPLSGQMIAMQATQDRSSVADQSTSAASVSGTTPHASVHSINATVPNRSLTLAELSMRTSNANQLPTIVIERPNDTPRMETEDEENVSSKHKASYATSASSDTKPSGDAMRRISRITLSPNVMSLSSSSPGPSNFSTSNAQTRMGWNRRDRLIAESRKTSSTSGTRAGLGAINEAFEGTEARVQKETGESAVKTTENAEPLVGKRIYVFVGKRNKSKYDFSLLFNAGDIDSWIDEERYRPRRLVEYDDEKDETSGNENTERSKL